MKTLNETNGSGLRVKGARTLARCACACRTAARRLKQFREELSAKLSGEFQVGAARELARHAMDEAEALAWSTRYPLLFLPELAEEKVQGVRQWARRQREILKR